MVSFSMTAGAGIAILALAVPGCGAHDAFRQPAADLAAGDAPGRCARDPDDRGGEPICLHARTDCSAGSFDCDRALVDPVGQLRALAPHGEPARFRVGEMVGVTRRNHFQAVQRLAGPGPARFLVTRSTADPGDSDFGLVELGDRPGDAAADGVAGLGLAGFPGGERRDNRLIRAFDTGTAYTHAGGGQRVGRIFALPLERDARGSAVFIYDVSAPRAPRLLSMIPHRGPAGERVDQAGTASLAALADGRFLLVIGRRHANQLDFYLSTTADVATTGWRYLDHWSEDELNSAIGDRSFGDYQNLALLPEAGGGLYMLGSHRDSTGVDWLDLHQLGVRNDARGRITAVVTKVGRKHLRCSVRGVEHCNLDAGAGAYVGADGRLRVYAIAHEPARLDGFRSAESAASVAMMEFVSSARSRPR